MPEEELLDIESPENKPVGVDPVLPDLPTNVSDEKLIETLRKERAERQKAEQRAKAAATKEAQLQAQLDKYKEINPERYKQLLDAEQERQEASLLQKQEYEQLKTRQKAEVDSAKKEAGLYRSKYEDQMIKSAFESAFYGQGGQRPTTGILEGEIASPVGTALSYLRGRITLRDGLIEVLDTAGQVELNKEGKAKSLAEKLEELKQSSWGFLFNPENSSSGSGMNPIYGEPPSGARVYSAEAARTGRASIDDIASGKARIV